MPTRSQHHTIVALVEDKPGVLNRIASKWRQRGFNIESLAVGHSELPGLSRMTFTHQFVRAVFLEQLYRAFTILRNEKYHHE